MAKRFAFIGLTLITGLMVVGAKAQNNKYSLNGQNFVSTAVPFLRISPDARSGGMGDVGIAISPDANAQYWNVGKMPFAEKKYGVAVTYTPWLKDLVPDIFLAYLSGYAKIGQNNDQAISASMRYFSLGNIQYTDINANQIGTGMPREYSFDLGYSRRLSENLGIGLSLRYIHSAIASGVNIQQGMSYKPGNAFAADLGIFYTKTKELEGFKNNTFSFGAVLSNVGSKISYNSTRSDFIPMNLGIGASYGMQVDEYNKIIFSADVNKLLVPAISSPDTQIGIISGIFNSFDGTAGSNLRQMTIAAGGEYWYQNQFAVRAGYFYEDKTNGNRKYFSCGIGVRYNVFQLNAAYLVPSGSGTTRNPLSNTVRFTLLFEFDKIEKQQSSE